MPSDKEKQYKQKDEWGEWRVIERQFGTVRILIKPSNKMKKEKGDNPGRVFDDLKEMEKEWPGVTKRRMRNIK